MKLEIIKWIILIAILGLSTSIGIKISQRYMRREFELKEVKSALNMFKSKIKYTYEPIPDTFMEIANNYSCNISNMFRTASIKMKEKSAGEAWNEAVDSTYSNMNNEDKNVLKSLSKMLGKTDLDGQLKEIELTDNFLNYQIEKAEKERMKNEKLYKTLGFVAGVGIVIILV